MNIAQRLQELLKEKGISRSKFAREIGVHTSTVSNWLDGKDVKSENLSTICSYFGCSLDYLTHTAPETKKAPTLNERDRRDIAKDLQTFIDDMESGNLMFDGDPMSPEAKESIIAAMKLGLEAAKAKNKERFTPKKYKNKKD